MSNTATSFRQNGQPLEISKEKLEHQRRQIIRRTGRHARSYAIRQIILDGGMVYVGCNNSVESFVKFIKGEKA